MGVHTYSSNIGLVVIGRNEGERLRICLKSAVGNGGPVIYVDSGSTDGSVALAEAIGAEIVNLDLAQPFTAARARNEGWRRLAVIAPEVQYVQFIDGDCELTRGWLTAASVFLDGHPGYAVVAGRLRERYPERSVFNRLCDIEWRTPVGEAKACGGIVMMRMDALRDSGGFRDDMIAGEEPELCVRLRASGWRIYRLDHDMAWHDANMLHWRQWWRRNVRGGYAFAEGVWLHGQPPERHWVTETRRVLFWGLVIPVTVIAASCVLSTKALGFFVVYPLQMARLYWREKDWARAFFLVCGKFAETWGVMQFLSNQLLRRTQPIIEYK